MNATLWALTLSDLRAQTARSSPTPGGGSVAAVTATLGCSLLLMAIDVTTASGRRGPDDQLDLAAVRAELSHAADEMAAAADGDIAAFAALMSAYRLPREGDHAREVRRDAIRRASREATEVPLALAEACVRVVGGAGALAEAVSPTIVSDVWAGRDLLTGAGSAALRTVAINVASLDDATTAQVAQRVTKIEEAAPQLSGIVPRSDR